MASVTCTRCGEAVDLETATSARCPNCSAPLDVSIDLQSGRVTPSRVALVVDDAAEARGRARTALEGEGYVVVEASNGPDSTLVAAEHNPSIALVDEHMPAMSGEHASRLLRRTAPGVLIVAYTEDPGAAPAWADGVVDKNALDRLPSLLSSLVT